MPGYIFPYILFRSLFNQNISLILLGIFTVLISVFASLKLYQLIIEQTGSKVAGVISLISLEILPYYWHWDWTLHPNSPSASCLILAVFYLYRFFTAQKKSDLFYAGFFLTWLFFLRGFTFLFIPITLPVLFFFMKKNQYSIKNTILYLSLFLSPLLFSETAWISRNYISLHEFIPLQTSFVPGANSSNGEYGYGSYTKYSMTKLRELINCWGGDNFWYFKNADLKWFASTETELSAEEQFSKKIFSEKLDPASLNDLRMAVSFSFRKDLSQAQHDSIEKLVVQKSTELRNEFMRAHTLYFYFVAPIMRLNNFLIKNTTQDWPGLAFKDSPLWKKSLKLLSLLIYTTSILLMTILFILRSKNILKQSFLLLLSLYSICIILTFAIVINSAHYSYYIFGYIPSVILIICVLTPFIREFKGKRKFNTI
ncbi:MAG TPA: glycosyltransferase family 39 protein [Bacteroidia bacterium]|nr:glycosyltransferase family 39 protein [Bacteroidia bacterium]